MSNKRYVVWGLAMMLSTGIAEAQPPNIATALDRVMAVAGTAGLAGEIALADGNGRIVDRARGLADRARRRPHRVGARWLWASVTKQVAAVLIMQQVEAGAMALDAPIHRYLPDWPGAGGDRITVRQLLQHQSGLPNPNDSPAGADGVPAFYRETGARIGERARAYGYCAAGSGTAGGAAFFYNNCDYLVLGAMLERVSGRPFATLVADRIARPLGLRSVAMAQDGAPRGGVAAVGYAGAKPVPSINVATFGAAGALTGSARDLLAFDRALLAGTLLKPESRAVLWEGNPKLGYQALGAWSFTAKLDGCSAPVVLVERRGDVGGIQVRNVIAPAIGRSVAIFTNDDSVDFGEIWQGRGLSYALLSAAYCSAGAGR